MNILTIKSKALNAAKELADKELIDVQLVPFVAGLIETQFTFKTAPEYEVAPFSGIVGCGIFVKANPQTGRPICLIPAQWPKGGIVPAVMPVEKKYEVVKRETERIARLICAALNQA